ncbi:MAG: hypothetical protein ACXIVD_11480 [Salinarimonas sp.]
MPTVGNAARQNGTGIAGRPAVAARGGDIASRPARVSSAAAQPDPAGQRTPRDAEFERWRNAPAAWLAERLAEAAMRDAQATRRADTGHQAETAPARAVTPVATNPGTTNPITSNKSPSQPAPSQQAACGRTASLQRGSQPAPQSFAQPVAPRRNPLEGAEAIARRLRQNEERLVATEAAVNRHAEALTDAERRASEAESRLAETHSLVGEARRYANEAQTRLAEMQNRLDEACRRAQKAEQRAEAAEATRADIEERAARAFAIMKERIAAAEAEADAAQEALTRHREESRQYLSDLEETLAAREDALKRKDAEMQARINEAQRDAQARIFAVQARLDIAEIRLAKAREALEAESLTPVSQSGEVPALVQGPH